MQISSTPLNNPSDINSLYTIATVHVANRCRAFILGNFFNNPNVVSLRQTIPTIHVPPSTFKIKRAHSKFKNPKKREIWVNFPSKPQNSTRQDPSEEFSSYALGFRRILFLRTRFQKSSLPTHSVSEEFSSYALGFRRVLFIRTRFQKSSLPTYSVSEEFSSYTFGFRRILSQFV